MADTKNDSRPEPEHFEEMRNKHFECKSPYLPCRVPGPFLLTVLTLRLSLQIHMKMGESGQVRRRLPTSGSTPMTSLTISITFTLAPLASVAESCLG